MYKKSIYLAIALSIIITACGDTTSFTVNESEYRGEICDLSSEHAYINTVELNSKSQHYKYNFENNICPKDFPKCIANTEPDNPGFHCEAEARKGCEKDGINYEHNDSICMNDPDQKGIILTCNNEKWDTAHCETSCNSKGNGCGECINDDLKYDNIKDEEGFLICQIMSCQNGQWKELPTDSDKYSKLACSQEVSCKTNNNNKLECGECKENEVPQKSDYKCVNSESGGQIKQCINGQWLDSKTCINSNKEVTDCADKTECGECKNDEFYFKDSDSICKKYLCQKAKFNVDETYSCKSSCNPDATDESNKCGICTNGHTRCTEKDGQATMETCIEGKWRSPVSCDQYSCHDDKCGECQNNNEFFIENEDDAICQHKKCINGELVSASDNPNKFSCNSDFTGLGKCNNKKYKDNCTDGIYKTCIRGEIKTMTCPGKPGNPGECDGNACKSTPCEETEPNRCTDGFISKCENKKLKHTPCELGICANDLQCAECLNSECKNNDDGKALLKECKDHLLKSETMMEFSCNENMDGVGKCLNGSTLCKSDGDSKPNIEYLCQNGNWKTVKNCGSLSCNIDNTACGECSNKTIICKTDQNTDMDSEQICQNGSWNILNKCQSNENEPLSCQNDSSCGECLNGNYQCIATPDDTTIKNIINKCENGTWTKIDSCKQSCTKTTDKIQCGICNDGETKFEENVEKLCIKYECQNGIWKEIEKCTTSCQKDNGVFTQCGECINYENMYTKDSFIHAHDTVYSCYSGELINHFCVGKPTQFGDYYSCTSAPKCYNDSSSGQVIGKQSDHNPCPSNNSCKVTGIDHPFLQSGWYLVTECGECSERTTRCRDSLTQQTCVNGTWAFPENCKNGCANDKCK